MEGRRLAAAAPSGHILMRQGRAHGVVDRRRREPGRRPRATARLRRPAHGRRRGERGADPMTAQATTSEPRLLDPAACPDHLTRLYRAAWAMCGSREDAEDLVQETYCT